MLQCVEKAFAVASAYTGMNATQRKHHAFFLIWLNKEQLKWGTPSFYLFCFLTVQRQVGVQPAVAPDDGSRKYWKWLVPAAMQKLPTAYTKFQQIFFCFNKILKQSKLETPRQLTCFLFAKAGMGAGRVDVETGYNLKADGVHLMYV